MMISGWVGGWVGGWVICSLRIFCGWVGGVGGRMTYRRLWLALSLVR